MSKILVTGAAGFIGCETALKLLELGNSVVGIDNLNDYYDVSLKEARLQRISGDSNFKFVKMDIADRGSINTLFESESFDYVINLAAQAGVRYSLENPQAYMDSNMTGFFNILEACRHYPVKHLVYASSSSVYGANSKVPFEETDVTAHQVSLYAATKKSNEVLAHSYSSLYDTPVSGLRFFTVYGPWGRPDMAAFLFTKAILNDDPINVFNNGDMKRDFTYIDDIVNGILSLLEKPPVKKEDWDSSSPKSGSSYAPYEIFNIGRNQPVDLMEFIETLEEALGKKAERNYMPIQPGDVYKTYASSQKLMDYSGYEPSVSLKEGIVKFAEWYRSYYKI